MTAVAASLTAGSVGAEQPVTFQVKDQYGNAVANSNVAIKVTSTDTTASAVGTVSATTAGPYAATATVVTNAYGFATVDFKPGAAYSATGTYIDTITATDNGQSATTTYQHN